MNDVLETIKSRRSIRKYKSDMVPQDKLEKIIEAEPMRQPEWANSPRSSLR